MSLTIVHTYRLLGTNFFPFLLNYTVYFRNIIYIIPLLYVFTIIFIRGINKKVLYTLLVIFVLLIFSIIANKEIFEYVREDIIIFITRIIIGSFLYSFCNDYQKLTNKLCKYIILIILYIFLLAITGYTKDYMSYSYGLLLPVVFFGIIGIETRNLIYGSVCILGLFYILLYGARGAFISGLATIAVYLISFSKVSVKKIVMVLLTLIISILVATNLDQIIQTLFGNYQNSRTLRLITAGRLTDGVGRDLRYAAVLKNISFFPKGLFSDRLIILKEVSVVSYPHNLFLELLYQFGLVIGGALCIVIIINFIKVFLIVTQKNNKYLNALFYSLVVIYLIKSMISGSYLNDYTSGAALGLCINIIKNNHKMGFNA